jgi:hypothetical protein
VVVFCFLVLPNPRLLICIIIFFFLFVASFNVHLQSIRFNGYVGYGYDKSENTETVMNGGRTIPISIMEYVSEARTNQPKCTGANTQ